MKQSSQPQAQKLLEGWHGSLDLEYIYHDGSTQVSYNHARSPLKLQRPFYPEGPAVCHSLILHTAGGIVGGDHLSLNFYLNPRAHALITTATASKIYGGNGLKAQQMIQVQVAAGACLEWLPQETIVFNGAVHQQSLRVELAPGATWLGWEITRLGRTAKGEKFLAGEWRSHTEIWQQDRPLWIDPQSLKGGAETLNSPHGLAGQPVIASLAWVGQAVCPEIIDKARLCFGQATRSLETAAEQQGEAGVTDLQSGLLCRYRGSSTWEARRWFIAVWHLLRMSFLERPACLPRAWPL